MSGSSIYFGNNSYSSQTFTSSGTFNVPDGVNLVFVEMWGGGGGGSEPVPPGGEGGKAGKSYVGQVAVTPGASVAVTIGSGGAGNTGGGPGGDGTDTSFGNIYARGGKGGSDTISSSPEDSFRAVAGTSTGGPTNYQGGDAGYEDGGNGVFGGTGETGGIGAGGGAGSVAGGNGGPGICIVHWIKN